LPIFQQLTIGNWKSAMLLGGLTEDQTIKIRVVPKGVEIVIVLRADTPVGLKVECFLERLQSQVNRSESSASRSQAIVNMRRFRLPLERSFKHFLRRYIFTSIELDDSAVIKRVGIAR
jgi:hypothetical protein